jgi:septum formation protein
MRSALKKPPLILASASPRRVELLGLLNLKFETIPGKTKEAHPIHLSPFETAQWNASNKARAIAEKHPKSLVLGADTIVCLGSKIFGKPASLSGARQMLAQLQGKIHQVVTGVCLMKNGKKKLFAVGTLVHFRALTKAQIDNYLKRIDPLDKAGAYAVQEFGHLIVERIDGSYSNVVGLPLERLREELNSIAW